MSLFSKIAGTISSFLQIGGPGGPGLNNNAGNLEARNSANTAFTIMRGATPVAANDLATKAYVDTGGASAAIMEIRFAVGTAATSSSVASIPANAQITEAELSVTTPFSGGTTISVGQTGSTSLLMATGDITATLANIYQDMQDTAWGASPLPVLVTVGGAPAAGAAVCIVKYTEPFA
jgi:hypothetical protein